MNEKPLFCLVASANLQVHKICNLIRNRNSVGRSQGSNRSAIEILLELACLNLSCAVTETNLQS